MFFKGKTIKKIVKKIKKSKIFDFFMDIFDFFMVFKNREAILIFLRFFYGFQKFDYFYEI